MENFVENTKAGYTLLTSQTDSEITCPDNDITAQAQPDGAVKIKFLKGCKVKEE